MYSRFMVTITMLSLLTPERPTFKVKHFSALYHEAFVVTEFNKIY
jgi:hypothetical protein